MSKTTEINELEISESENFELSTSSLMVAAQMEVQGSIIIAKKFPRNEDQTFAKLMKTCDRTSFAEKAVYSYPRGGQTVSGPSVNLAREAARLWGNLEYGLLVIRDDENSRHIRAWAWDKETNTKTFAEDSFEKLIFRKGKGSIKPDERDLRELTNRRGAILIRNCLLQLLPRDLVEDAVIEVAKTLKQDAKQDPEAARKKIILAFSQLNITPEMIEKKLKHPVSQCSPEELAELRQIWQSINDGNSVWGDYLEEVDGGNGNGNVRKETEKGTLSMDALKGKKNEPIEQADKPPVDMPMQSPKQEPAPEPPEQPKTDHPQVSSEEQARVNGSKLIIRMLEKHCTKDGILDEVAVEDYLHASLPNSRVAPSRENLTAFTVDQLRTIHKNINAGLGK